MSKKPDKEIKAEVHQTRRSSFEQIDKLPDSAETLEQVALQARHGTPKVFARKCVNAIGEITWQEAWDAIEKYKQQWLDAGATKDVGMREGTGTCEGVHFSSGGYLVIRVADSRLSVPLDAVQKVRDELTQRIAKMQRRVEMLDLYLQGHTKSDPSAL